MIKRLFIAATLFFSLTCVSAQDETKLLPNVYEQGFKYCEGTVAYKNMILVSNFGTSTFNPLNTEGKGYIMAINGAKIKPFIPSDGNLSAPKGMAVYDSHLFIADVGKVVVYNLHRLKDKPQIIKLADDDLFVNDIVVVGKMMLVSVTNTGRLYGLNIAEIDMLSYRKPMLLGDVPGPNGLAVYENNLYIASYNPQEKPTAENVIYVADISRPNDPLKKLITTLPAGQYDGIAMSADGNKLYMTSWTNTQEKQPAIWVYNMDGKTGVRALDFGVSFQGPADITLKDNALWIPDLLASKVYRFDL